jgi:hypothetical protein
MKLASVVLAFGVIVMGSEIAVLRAQPAPPPPPMIAAPETPPAAPAALAVTNVALSSKIRFAESIHDFGKVKVNEPAKCVFVFTNIGQAVLEVTAVHPGCGCTTAGEWTRKVEPGKTGTIPILYNAVGAPGPFGKTITVSCNDPGQASVGLQIKGILWKPVDVTPQHAVFNVTVESVSNATSIVRIINNEDAPLTLSAPESNNRFFAAVLKTNQPGKEFELVVRPVPPLDAERNQGAITLKTSSTNLPVININAAATLQPTLVATPPTIMAPAAPNTNNVRPVINIRNSISSPMKLSDPVINAKGVDVQINEIEPGKQASLTLTFPPDFTIAPGEKIQLSVKTGLANPPTFEVPVFQRPPRVAR